jgi:ribosomal protein S18 acetylase RimI-like enzyme
VVAQLAEQARAEVRDSRGGLLFLASEAWSISPAERFESAVGSPDAVFVVGCYDDLVFGYGLAMVRELGDGTALGVLEDLVVDPGMRKVGIGETMMSLLLDRLRSAGCIGVDSWALPGDRSTKNFFESFGLKARLLTVHLAFDDGVGGGTHAGGSDQA